MKKMKKTASAFPIACRHSLSSNPKSSEAGLSSIKSSVYLHSASNNFKASKFSFKYGFANIVGEVEDALSLYDEMVRMRPLPSFIEFSKLLSRLVRMKQYLAVISLYRNMSILKIQMDNCTMSMLIKCYCHMNRVDIGFSVMGCFLNRGYLPDLITFNTLLKGLSGKERIAEAEELLNKIISEKLCEPDVITYGTVIHGFCKNKMLDEALSLFYEMIERGLAPNVITYGCLLHGLCNLGKWKEANKLFCEMVESKIYPDAFVYNAIIEALFKEGKVEDAENLLHTMINRGYKPEMVTYNVLMTGYCLHGQIDKAQKVFDVMISAGPDPDFYSYNI